MRSRLTAAAGPVVVFAIVVACWYVVTYEVLDASRRFLMPAPHDVVLNGFFGPNGADMFRALGRTATVALVGLALAIAIGMLWAVVMDEVRWAERSLFPYAVVLQSIPILAIVPLIGFWFGFGQSARTLVCVLIALFPMVANTMFGLKSVDRNQRDLFALHHASRRVVLWRLKFPAALPAIFAGMRISAGLSVVGAIVGDFFFKQGKPGLGILISNYGSRLQSADLFAAILLAAALGVVVFQVFGWISHRVVGTWHDPAVG